MAKPRTLLHARVRRGAAIALAAGLLLTGCRLFTSPGHDTATLEIDANPATTVGIITSNNFAVTRDAENQEVFHLFTADTAWVDVPFSGDYDLRETAMFFARAFEAEDPDAVISFRVLVDGSESFARQSVLEGVGIRFYYVGF